jgi:Restriction Endonuclease associating with ARP
MHPRAFALAKARFPHLKWHLFADSPSSSQALALSAFLPVLEFPDRDAILEEFVTRSLPGIAPRAGRSWEVMPEYERPELLGEAGGGEPTRVDILLVAQDAVVCVEAKYRADAGHGWGACTQPRRLCEGYHGLGSDRKGSRASCRLGFPDGHRGPRLYWHVARNRFREQVFAPQTAGDICPYLRDYQLVRNYLFAAELARQEGKTDHGVIGVAPSARLGRLAAGVERFTRDVLQPAQVGRVAVASFEGYAALLATGSGQAQDLARFLGALLD